MIRRLAFSVTLTPEDSTEPVTFEAGTTPPEWATTRITNADAWVDDDTSTQAAEAQPSETQRSGGSATRSGRSRRSSSTTQSQESGSE